MIEFLYLLIGSIIFYGIFDMIVEVLRDIIDKKHELADARDTDERAIAGEDTSEVAKNYLEIVEVIEYNNETR